MAFGNGTNLASEKRTFHILIGEKPGYGGHQFPGNFDIEKNISKSLFPSHWPSGKITKGVSDVATNPKNVWVHQTGNGGLYTKAGVPARFVTWGIYDRVRIRVVIEPAGRGIVTGFPDP